MKTSLNILKRASLLMATLILIQSCRVYKKTPVTISEAIQLEKRVKLKTKEGDILKFKKIIVEDDVHYGIKRTNGALNKVPISLKNIESVRVQNKTLSIVYGILWPITATFGFALLAVGIALGGI